LFFGEVRIENSNKNELNKRKKEKAGLPGPKKIKRPNLAISSFKKGQIMKNEKRPNKGQISFKFF